MSDMVKKTSFSWGRLKRALLIPSGEKSSFHSTWDWYSRQLLGNCAHLVSISFENKALFVSRDGKDVALFAPQAKDASFPRYHCYFPRFARRNNCGFAAERECNGSAASETCFVWPLADQVVTTVFVSAKDTPGCVVEVAFAWPCVTYSRPNTRNKYLRKSVKLSVFFPCFTHFPYFVQPWIGYPWFIRVFSVFCDYIKWKLKKVLKKLHIFVFSANQQWIFREKHGNRIFFHGFCVFSCSRCFSVKFHG